MAVVYPIKFTLSDGVHIVVSQVNENTFDFALKSEDGNERPFTIIGDEIPKDKLIETFDFIS